jgi:Ser/Thr protein kinase RdoA (MazF antagonist)
VTETDAGTTVPELPADAADFAALARRAVERHGFGPDARLHGFSLTENPTFRVEGDGRDDVVVRIYRPGGRPAVEIRSELAWMAALRHDAGVPAPEVLIPSGEEEPLVDLGVPGAPVYAAVFAYVPGRTPGDDELPALIETFGEMTARIHRHARAWTPPAWFSRPRWDLSTTLGERPHWGPWQRGVAHPAAREQLDRLSTVVSRRLAAYGDGPDRFGLVHADLRASNLLVDGDRLGVLDFDDAGFSWYLYDLAGTLTFSEGRADLAELLDRWATAYRSVEQLSREDEREVETFLMLRRLLITAYVGLRPDTELAAELKAAGYDEETCRLAEAYLSRFG